MKRITVSINGEVIRKFKETAKIKFGTSRGAYKKAAEEALQAWIREKNPLK